MNSFATCICKVGLKDMGRLALLQRVRCVEKAVELTRGERRGRLNDARVTPQPLRGLQAKKKTSKKT